MRILVITAILFLGQCVNGQVVDFENFELGLDSALVDSGGEGGFISGDLFFPNNYDSEFMFFTEWAISSKRDTLTAGPTNSTSSYAGGGFESDVYGVTSAFNPVVVNLTEPVAGTIVEGMYITNNTYAALSIKEGDAFAKKFGGETGDDPDFFLLTIKAWSEGELSSDSIDFFLADYRFEDNEQDYIIKDWTWVDLTVLGPVDSLLFSLSSSDLGIFGMNTPAFFCVDNITLQIESSASDIPQGNIDLKIYPNPASEYINLDLAGDDVQVFNSTGKLVENIRSVDNRMSVSNLPPGIYILRSKTRTGKFIKI